MTPSVRSARWWRAILGIRTDREIISDVLHEPGIRRARRLIKEVEQSLAKELAAIEGEKPSDE